MSRRLQRKARGERPHFFDDPSVDKVVAMVMGLAGEVAVMRDRVDTLERLLETKGLVKRNEIEQYAPDAKVAAERAQWREGFLSEVLRIVEIELEAAQMGDTAPYDTAVEAVTTDRAAAKPRAKKSRSKKSGGKK